MLYKHTKVIFTLGFDKGLFFKPLRPFLVVRLLSGHNIGEKVI